MICSIDQIGVNMNAEDSQSNEYSMKIV